MLDRFQFLYNRLKERLWIKPLLICLLSILVVGLARLANGTEVVSFLPFITLESIEKLLNILSSSMLVRATFAVASMISAYTSASATATPRSFSLIVSDDVSQNALSTFIGTFIFSVIALISIKNEVFDKAGLLVLFTVTVVAFMIVVATFVRWVDQIARLGLLGSTIDKVEAAAKNAIKKYKHPSVLGALPASSIPVDSKPIYSEEIGYVQRVNFNALQACAAKLKIRLSVAAIPGTFIAPDVPIAYALALPDSSKELQTEEIVKSFIIGDDRKFDEDPRFGLIALSEIAVRALSPAVNDPGTAIDIIGSFVRLFALWSKSHEQKQEKKTNFDRLEIPEIPIDELFSAAFSAISRDGAGLIEVITPLQQAFRTLASIGDPEFKKAAVLYSEMALARAKAKMNFPPDLEAVSKLAKLV